MADSMPVLVAPDALGTGLRAPAVAAAIGRGLERAGVAPPDLCPVAGGGRGTLEVLLPALGGETVSARVLDALGREVVAGFALLDDGGAAIVEAAEIACGIEEAQLCRGAEAAASDRGAEAARGDLGAEELGDVGPLGVSSYGTGQLIAAAITAGAQVVFLAAGGSAGRDDAAGAVQAIEDGGGLRGANLVVLCEERIPWAPAGGHVDGARRLLGLDPGGAWSPHGAALGGAGRGLAGGLWARLGAELVSGAAFVLEELGFDARMRAARAVVVADRELDARMLGGRVSGEIAVRARQAGVPCHAIGTRAELAPFDVRMLDLQAVLTAESIPELEAAGEELARYL